jgi:hypothetical protein
MFSPETNPIILAHEPIAASALLATSDSVNLKGAKGVFIVVTHARGDDQDLTLTVDQGETEAEAYAGTHKVTTLAEFPIWVTYACGTSDIPVRQTDAITYVIDAGVLTGTCIVIMYIKAALLDADHNWVHLCAAGTGTGLVSVLYILDGVRYQQASPLTAIA